MTADEGGKAIVAKLAETGQAEAKVDLPPARLVRSAGSATGARRSRSSTARTTASSPCRTRSSRSVCPRTSTTRGSGDNPLTKDDAFLNDHAARCGDGPARRETDTMDTFIDSSWYWFRYLSPEKAGGPIDRS